jgi:hypothetical protein
MGNTGTGIFVANGVTNSTVKKNVALGNAATDVKDDNATCDSNTWYGNVFGTSDVAGGGPDPCLQ